MEALFTTDIIVHGANKNYDVFFEQGSYVFHDTEDRQQTFRLRREHDEWLTDGLDDAIAQQQAAHALDQYLLSQH